MSFVEKMALGAAAWLALSVLVGLGFGRWMRMVDEATPAPEEEWEPRGWQIAPVRTNVLGHKEFTERLKADETLTIEWTLHHD